MALVCSSSLPWWSLLSMPHSQRSIWGKGGWWRGRSVPQDKELWLRLWQGLGNPGTTCSYKQPPWVGPWWQDGRLEVQVSSSLPCWRKQVPKGRLCTATIRAGILMLQNMGFENSTVGMKLMFSLFLSLQDNEAKSNKPKCNRTTGLKMCVKFVVRISKICSRL